MKVIICDKCKKPISIKDVRHIVVRTEETEHILDFCNCCYFAIAESIESLKDLDSDNPRKVISDIKKAALDKMIDEGILSSAQMAAQLGLKHKTVINYRCRYLKAKRDGQTKKVVSEKKIDESLLQKKENIEPNADSPEVTDQVIPEKKPIGRPRKLKVDAPKANALLAAGWSYEKMARSEFHCSVEELKNVLEESKSHQ